MNSTSSAAPSADAGTAGNTGGNTGAPAAGDTPAAGAGAPASAAAAVGVKDPAPAADPAGTAGTPAAGAEGQVDFLSGFNEELRPWVANKAPKDLNQLAMMYRNLEQLVGDQKSLIKLPPADDEAGWNEVFTKLGRPETPDSYKIEIPAEGGDEKLAGWARGIFHKAGLSQAQVEKIVPEWNKMAAEQMAAVKQAVEDQKIQQFQSEMDTLRQQWGPQYDARFNNAKQAIIALGVTPDELDAMSGTAGFDKIARLMDGIYQQYGVGREAGFPGGRGDGSGAPAGGTTGVANAKLQLEQLRNDGDFMTKYYAGDPASVRRFNDLQKQAAPSS